MSRLIDVDTFREEHELAERCVDCPRYGKRDCVSSCYSARDFCAWLNYAPTIDAASQWISVKERLPSDQSPVLVYIDSYTDEQGEEYFPHVGMSYYTYSAKGGFWCGTDGNVYGAIGIIHTPTYWMPLPEPPKEVSE